MSLTYKVTLKATSSKFLARQDNVVRQRIYKALKGLEKAPPIGDIRPMKGQLGVYRLRIGTYRVIYEVNHVERMIIIRTIGNRGDVYK